MDDGLGARYNIHRTKGDETVGSRDERKHRNTDTVHIGAGIYIKERLERKDLLS